MVGPLLTLVSGQFTNERLWNWDVAHTLVYIHPHIPRHILAYIRLNIPIDIQIRTGKAKLMLKVAGSSAARAVPVQKTRSKMC